MVNINYRYVENELQYIFDNSDMVALIHERRYSDKVANVLPNTPKVKSVIVVEDGTDLDFSAFGIGYEDALAQSSGERDFEERSNDDIFMLYTGGTTGSPKGVMWRHEDWWRVLGGGINFVTGVPVEDEYEMAKVGAANPSMIRYPIPPMIHGGSQSAVFHSLFGGGTCLMHPEFDAHEVWQNIDKHKVNLIFITGDAMGRPMLDALIAGNPETGEPYDLSTLYVMASSAALFSPSIQEQFLELLPNRLLTDSIGASETGFGGLAVLSKGQKHTGGPTVKIDASTTVLDDDGNEVEPGSGKRGMLARKGNIPLGYYKDEVKTAETFRTINGVRYSIPGDYAQVEADGTVTMLGRGSVSINSGGEKVYPEEVEGALKAHPDIFDVLVVGIPDERFGQRVAAVVQVREARRRRCTTSPPQHAKRLPDTRFRAACGSWTRSSATRQASPTTAGRRPKRNRARPTITTETALLWRPQTKAWKPDAFGSRRQVRHRIPDFRIHSFRARRGRDQRAGGLGVLGCVRFNDPEELEAALTWMDENTDGKRTASTSSCRPRCRPRAAPSISTS